MHLIFGVVHLLNTSITGAITCDVGASSSANLGGKLTPPRSAVMQPPNGSRPWWHSSVGDCAPHGEHPPDGGDRWYTPIAPLCR